jgi:DNA-binding SARP family transcriptional activator/tetratricopeptide (TPR) repeat protein
MHAPADSAAPGAGADPAARSARPPLRVALIDVPTLHVGAERVALERKTAALIALLALGGVRARAGVAALLWPDVSLAQGRNSLRQRLFRLQRAAGCELVGGADVLELAADVAHDAGDPRAALGLDAQACRGELLGALDFSDTPALADWVEMARERWRRQRAAALAALAAGHEERHEVVRALAYAERLVADEPLLEHAHRRVMRLHYLHGDRAAALAAYERCRDKLKAELGTAPDRETAALAAQIGASGSAVLRAPVPTLAVLRPPRLVGRDAQRARLAAALAARGVVVLIGEPGIGKSRLLDEVVQGAAGVLAGGGHAGDANVPYALLARIVGAAHARFEAPLEGWVATELARLVPQLGIAPTARLDALRLQQALTAALDAWSARGLIALVADDLHHADEASLEALLALAGAPSAPRLAWLFAVRRKEMPTVLQSWLAAAEAGSVETLGVPALDGAGVVDLLDSLELPQFNSSEWALPLVAHSSGNPLFVLETLRALLALGAAAPAPGALHLPVPAVLGALIERRLAQLDEPALRLLRVAALAGADFDAEVAARVLQTHPLDIVEPWRELEQADLLQHGRFTHDLIAETAAAGLPASIAETLHARLAEALESLGRGAARIAPHWAAARAWSRAGDAFAAAAQEARRASRRADEVLLWQRAADAFDQAGQPGKAFDARADGLESAIVVRGIQAAGALVEQLTKDARTEPQRMRALTAHATARLFAGDHAAGEAAARAALELATRLGALWPRFEAARVLAVALAQAYRSAEALAVIEPLQAVVEAEGDLEQRGHFWSDYAYVLKSAQRLHATADALKKAIANAQEAGDYAELATLTSNLAVLVSNFGTPQESLDHGKRARALRDPLGQVGGPAAGAIDLYIGVANGALGRYAEALDDFERASACFADNGQSVWIALVANYEAALFIHLGQYARAQQLIAGDAGDAHGVNARRHLLRSRIQRALGAGTGAASLDKALALVETQGEHLVRMLVRLDAALTRAPLEAAAACQALRLEAETAEHAGVAMRARVLRIGALVQSGALAGERAEIDAVAALLDGVQPADTYQPEAWWLLSQAYDALADDAAAQAALVQAFEWLAERALPNVPAPFRESFLHRNLVNRDLVAAAGRRLGLRLPPPPLAPG